MQRILGLFIILYFLSASAKPSLPTSVNTHMMQLHEHIGGLAPMLFSTADYADSRNEDLIGDHLRGLELTALQMEHKKIFSDNFGAQVIFDVLMRSLADASRAFEDGNKNYSRYMLKGALSSCINCHTSGVHTKNFSFLNEAKIYETLPTDTARIELYLTTRQFEKAKDLSERVLAEYPTNHAKTPDLSFALEQLVTYYARLNFSKQKAVAFFSQLQEQENIPTDVKKDIGDILVSFKNSKIKPASSGTSVAAELTQLGKQIGIKKGDALLSYDPQLLVQRMQALASTHRLLASNRIRNTQDLGIALHFLGLINNYLNREQITQVDDAYFAICIETIPHSAIATRCYLSLEESVMAKSSGSAGTFIDIEDLRMLSRYKRLAHPIFEHRKTK